MHSLQYITGVSPITEERDPNPTPPPDLGSAFYIFNMVLNALLALSAILLNSTMMMFHKNNLKDTVPFTYFTLSASDFVTGVCAALHSLVFLLLLVPRTAHNSAAMFCLVAGSYTLTLVSIRVSCFVSLVFAMIRTVNIVWPFQVVYHKLVVAVIACYTAVWMCVFISEIAVFVGTKEADANVDDFLKEALHALMRSYFYEPADFKLIDYLIRSGSTQLSRDDTAELCVINISYTAIPVTLCAVLAGAAALLQLHTLARRQRTDPNWRDNKEVSVTITLITLAFVLCSSSAICLPIYNCLERSEVVGHRDLPTATRLQMFYLLSYTPFFVNAALNPLIFAVRVKVFKEWVRDKLGTIRKVENNTEDNNRSINRRSTVNSQMTSISRCNSGDSHEIASQHETNL